MEEDSEKRRERLKAMRAAAAQAEASASASSINDTHITSSVLANPLLDPPPPATLAAAAPSPRFDFYTDPMSAFSANKRTAAAGPRNVEMTPPAHHMRNNYSVDQRMYQAQSPYHNAVPSRSPSPQGISRPLPMHQGTPPQAWSGPGGAANYYGSAPHRGMPGPYPTNRGNASFKQVRSPGFNYGQGRGNWLGNSSSPGSGRGGSPAFNSGRGQGQWHGGRSQGLGWSGGRGHGFRSHGSAKDDTTGPECFYDKSMVEDPWKNMEPIVWKGVDATTNNLNASGSSDSLLSKYSSFKKPRVSEPSNKPSSGQSLAEYLAASFNEAVNDGSSV